MLAAAPLFSSFFFLFFFFGEEFLERTNSLLSRLTLFFFINSAGLRPRYLESFVRWILVYAWIGGGGEMERVGRDWGGTWSSGRSGGVLRVLWIFFSFSIIAAVMVWYRRFHEPSPNFV